MSNSNKSFCRFPFAAFASITAGGRSKIASKSSSLEPKKRVDALLPVWLSVLAPFSTAKMIWQFIARSHARSYRKPVSLLTIRMDSRVDYRIYSRIASQIDSQMNPRIDLRTWTVVNPYYWQCLGCTPTLFLNQKLKPENFNQNVYEMLMQKM